MAQRLDPPQIAHSIDLGDFGGLQTLYAAFITRAWQDGARFATINRGPSGSLAPVLTETLPADLPIFSAADHWAQRALDRVASRTPPAFGHWLSRRSRDLRGRSIDRHLRASGIARVVSWNGLPTAALARAVPDLVVYDHGLSWLQQPSHDRRQRMNLASSFIAVSAAARRMLEELWEVGGPVHVVPNPIRFAGEGPPPRLSRLAGDRIVVGGAGRFVSFKGFPVLVMAVAELRRRGLAATLRLAGGGPDEVALRQLAARLGIETHVEFLGVVRDMEAFYAGIDVFVCPSLREPYGLVAIEALACGCPTIIADVDGLPESLPFAGAAMVVAPSLTIADYVRRGGSATKIQAVYHPQSDRIGPPLALAPECVADAIAVIAADYGEHGGRAARAAEMVRRDNGLDAYMARLLPLVEGAG